MMDAHLWFIFLFCVLKASISMPTQNESFNDYLKQTLMGFKSQMKEGIPELKVPILDPLSVPEINLHHKRGVVDISLEIENLMVSGLSEFEMPKLNVNLEETKIEFELYIPTIVASSENYKLNGKIARIIPITGSGAMKLQADGVRIKCYGGFKMSPEGNIQLSSLKLDVSFSKLETKFDNLLGSGNLSNVVNSLINFLGKPLFNILKPKLLNMTEKSIINLINKNIGKYNIQGILSGK